MDWICFALIMAASATGGACRSDLGGPLLPASSEVLQYDDGISYWIIASGGYRAVWFDPGDFHPGLESFTVTEVQFSLLWGSVPHAHVALYSSSGPFPGELLAQAVITSGTWVISPPITVYGDWMVVLSSEGGPEEWPILPSDNTPNFTGTDHSFHSDDFATWEPWIGDYLIRTSGVPNLALEPATWADVKSLFQGGR